MEISVIIDFFKLRFSVKIFAQIIIHSWIIFSSLASSPAVAQTKTAYQPAVATAHPLATQVGEAILAQGGNAFDAAVAISAALAVVEPYSSGLGGGGFWLLHQAQENRDIMIDGREVAPANASKDMYLDADKKPIAGASLRGPLAAAIPGTPAAIVHISKKYGQLTLAQNLAPAIKLARDGFNIDPRFLRVIRNHQKKLNRYPTSANIFLTNKQPPSPDSKIYQTHLASTLSTIAKQGHDGFYRGRVAHEMTEAVRTAGGIWVQDDLARYHITERTPVYFNYRGARIVSASLPSSGGLTLAQSLNILEYFPLAQLSRSEQLHLIVESLRYAYRDRAELLGDSDFVSVPTQQLLSKEYAQKRARMINITRAGTSRSLHTEIKTEGTETTHFSVIDKMGNRVATTMSINTFFGSGFVAGKTGVILNNEMDDFSMGDNIPNIFGLYGKAVNAIAPGKRPLSSMSPTFIENEDGILIAGTPGGSRIISMLLLAIIDYIDLKNHDPLKIASKPRLHHQYLPDRIEIEPQSFDQKIIDTLRSKGHQIKISHRKWGNMQLIFAHKKTKQTHVANDSRGIFDTRY